MKLCLLASGSKGNSIFVETGDTRLLVDAGCSCREICHRLAGIGVDPGTLNGILVSHEHNDHISGVGTIARRFDIPVVISYPTMNSSSKLFKKTNLIQFESGYSFCFRDLEIDPFPVTHDASDPVGFVLESREGKVAIATDLGIATRLVREKLKGARGIVLETNHDEEMLLNGPYPWHLKQRIRSRHGHLSNSESVEMLEELLHDGLEALLLAHLSEVNNDPKLPMAAVTALLDSQNRCSPRLALGNQYKTSEMLHL